MPTIAADIEIDAPHAELFDLAQDYDLRLRWDPFIKAIAFRGGATAATVGVRVWVRAHNGLTMEVEYITVNRPDQVAMKMTSGPWIFRQFSGAWLFKPLAAARTRVVFRYNFAVRPRLLAPAVEPVVARVLARDMRLRLEGLKRGAETTDILAELRAKT